MLCLSVKWFYASVMSGSHGLCDGGGSESSPDLLVHSEIRQREPSSSVLHTQFSVTLSLPRQLRKEEESPRRLTSVLQHVSSSQPNIRLRTFQRMINMPIRYSGDERSRSIAICKQSIGSKGHMAVGVMWIGSARQVVHEKLVKPQRKPGTAIGILQEAPGPCWKCERETGVSQTSCCSFAALLAAHWLQSRAAGRPSSAGCPS